MSRTWQQRATAGGATATLVLGVVAASAGAASAGSHPAAATPLATGGARYPWELPVEPDGARAGRWLWYLRESSG